ncbi:NADH dehydrogenase 1 beta subcomplex subunit 2 [Popillia japonica]|uniref:NADH dehydrogenase 1 beta subcomplex subunit 2 n=1 Tax=Popillia japonica TaxID=7064 RepID=A0AAW1K105_POPJA
MVFGRIRSVLLSSSSRQSRLKTYVRHSHGSWNYRKSGPPPSKLIEFLATLAQGSMWWWILWHLFTEYQHVTGEWEYPNASKWTDEELGIPPDDFEADSQEEADVASAVAVECEVPRKDNVEPREPEREPEETEGGEKE